MECLTCRKKLGYLFQDAALFDSPLTLYENLALPLKPADKEIQR